MCSNKPNRKYRQNSHPLRAAGARQYAAAGRQLRPRYTRQRARTRDPAPAVTRDVHVVPRYVVAGQVADHEVFRQQQQPPPSQQRRQADDEHTHGGESVG